MEFMFSDKIKPLKPSAIREIFKSLVDPQVISLAAGNPAPECFPAEDIARIGAAILKERPIEALQYGITEGYAPLREKIKTRLKKENIGRAFDDVMIVSGAQQGMDLSCKVLCNEGDVIITENPSFIGSLNSFRSYNTRLVGVAMRQDGIDVEALEKAIRENNNVKLIYLIPTFQNPTGITTSLENRKRVYGLLKRYNLILIEDNPYSMLRFDGEDVPSIKSLDDEGRVIYVGSFSKVISPGMRVGYVCAHREIIQKLSVAKQGADVHTNIFAQLLVDRYLEECDLDASAKKMAAFYKGKCAYMLDAISRRFDRRVTTTHPEGGLFLWCYLPEGCDSFEFSRIAMRHKVAIVPGSAFSVDEGAVSNGFRLNFSMPSKDQIEKGIAILGDILKEYLPKAP